MAETNVGSADMSNPYPIPRSIRETEWLAGDGRTVYGPFDFQIFDVEDVRVNLRRTSTGETLIAIFEAVKVSDVPLSDFTVAFTGPITDEYEYQVQGHRLHERTSDLFRGGALRSIEVEKEVSKQAVVLQEVRRDVDAGKSQLDGLIGTVLSLTVRAEDAADASESAKDGAETAFQETVDLLNGAQDALDKARSSVQSVNGVDPDEAGNVTVSAEVADGTVTDPKLPEFDPFESPSSDKMRYLASTSTSAIAGAVQRPVSLKLSDRLDGFDFGMKADGVANDTEAMVAAFAAVQETGRPLFLPPGMIMVDAGTLKLGNGTASTYSTKNGQAIFGAGENAYMIPGAPGSGTISGTLIKARAGSNGILLDVVGGIGGITMAGFALDCGGVASTALNLVGVSHSDFERITIKEFTVNGLRLVGRATTDPNSPTWCANNTFKNLSISSSVNGGYSAGLFLDGDIATNRDPHRNTFINVVVQMNKTSPNPSYGAFFGMADSNTFIECDFSIVGTGLGYPLCLSNTTPGHPFPQNNFLYGCSLGGGEILVVGDIGDHFFVNHTTRDGEPLPNHPRLHGFTDIGEFFNDVVVNKNLASVELTSRDRQKRYRLLNNSNDSSDGGVHLQKWSTATSAWVTYFAIDSAGTPAIRLGGLGLKQIQAGDVDSGGSGFRRLVVSN